MQATDFIVDQSLMELTEHRTEALPIMCYETVVNLNINGHIPLHWHDELQFMLVTEGIAIVQINEEKLKIKKGEGLFINSGCLHMVKDEKDCSCTYTCLNVSPTFILPSELYASFVIPYTQATNFPYLHLIPKEMWRKEILETIQKIKQLFHEKPLHYELDISLQLTSLWKNIITNGQTLVHEQTEAIKNQRMKLMLNWIHTHYTDKILLDDIAKAGQLSRSECCRYFKRTLKTTPINYVTDYRIQKSLPLLQQSKATITDIAYEVGFNSTSYFIDKFRQSMKITPFVYRKDHFSFAG